MNIIDRVLSGAPYLNRSQETLVLDLRHFLAWCGLPCSPPNQLVVTRAVLDALEGLAERVEVRPALQLHNGEEVSQ